MLVQPDYTNLFPYQGRYWDSTRTHIQTFSSEFSSLQFQKTISIWKNEFALPEPKKETFEPDFNPATSDSTITTSLTIEGYTSCVDLEVEPQIRGGRCV